MGNFLFKKNQNNPHPQQQPNNQQSEINSQNASRKRKQPPKVTQAYDPAPVFKDISPNKMKAIELSFAIKELIYSQNWLINPEIVEHLRILNAFDYIKISNARTLTVELFHNVTNQCTAKIRLPNHSEEEEKAAYSFKIKNLVIQQQYSSIYASLFRLQFRTLRKLVINPNKNSNPNERLTSLEILQYLDSPYLEELHADGHNLTSVKFLRKCNWKRLHTLNLRATKISDSSHFAQIIPQITNSRHIETLNLGSEMSSNWYQISWLLKMGFKDAEEERLRMDNDDDYYYANNQRILRRVDFGIIHKGKLRQKHINAIRGKFNNHYFDNPLVLW